MSFKKNPPGEELKGVISVRLPMSKKRQFEKLARTKNLSADAYAGKLLTEEMQKQAPSQSS